MEMDEDTGVNQTGNASGCHAFSATYAGLDDDTLGRLARQHGLAQHEITELMLAFSALDVDGSGGVSVAELMEVVGCE